MTAITRKLLLGTLLAFSLSGYAQKKTTLSAEVYGYKQEMVYFDCLQSPFFNAEFHCNPGDEHLYSFETKSPVCMLINGQVNVLLLPGDSVHAVVRYDGKRPSEVVFSGSPKAVAANRMMSNIDGMKRQMRYKSQLLACVVVDVKPQQRIDDSRTLLSKVQEMVAKEKAPLSDVAAEYILATTEAAAYISFMEYPQMYAETRKTPITEQGIGDYWKTRKRLLPRRLHTLFPDSLKTCIRNWHLSIRVHNAMPCFTNYLLALCAMVRNWNAPNLSLPSIRPNTT